MSEQTVEQNPAAADATPSSEEDRTQTIVITGAGSGMGRATAELFYREGWNVIAVDIAFSDTYVAEFGALQPAANVDAAGQIAPVIADVRSRESVESALAAAMQSDALSAQPGSDRIDSVANIAGVYPPSTLETFDEETYRRIFDINVLGTLNVIAAARPYFAPGSTVINFASVDAFTVSQGQLLYCASKAAVVMITKSLALELAGEGVRVNGIAPGWVATPGNTATGRMDVAKATIPLGRVAAPEEIADWVHLMSSKRYTSFLAGETIVISGGDVMR